MYKRNILIAGVTMALLSGCGGSGSTEIVNEYDTDYTNEIDILTPDSTFADLTYGQQYEFDAVSQSFAYTQNADETHITSLISYPHSTDSTEITYGSDDNGLANYVKVEDHQTGVEFTISGASNFKNDLDGVVIVAENSSSNERLLFLNPTETIFEYQTFGTWNKEILGTSDGHGGVTSVGITTPVSGIPTSGTATYNGIALGYTTADDGEFGVAVAELIAAADFQNRSLAISTTNTITGDVSAPEYDMTGTLSYTSGSGVFSGNVLTNSGNTGLATGKFYGPNAEEIGGVISIQGDAILSAAALGFGAKR